LCKFTWKTWICVLCMFMITGCDPVRRTSQIVSLRITDITTEKQEHNATVSLKYCIERGEYFLNAPDQRWYKEWYNGPWDNGTTDQNGRVDIDIKWTTIDRTLGATPPVSRDIVSGQPYRVKIKKDQILEEINLIMREGELVRGSRFAIMVLKIQKPRYIKMK